LHLSVFIISTYILISALFVTGAVVASVLLVAFSILAYVKIR
jgi:hypothetical protein